MAWVIEVLNKQGIFDAVGHDVKKGIQDLGVKGVRDVSFSQIYRIYGKIDSKAAEKIARELLIDKISEECRINASPEKGKGIHVVEIAYNAGVMDPVGESTLKGINDLGIKGAEGVHTAKRYIIKGAVHPEKVRFIADKLLYNKTVQHIVKKDLSEISLERPSYKFKFTKIEILNKSKVALRDISRKGQLFLNAEEMVAIQSYFKKIGRNPTDVELESLAQTWSEHCKHKTFRGKIEYDGKVINNLLKETIMKVTEELDKDWCVSVFKDNSGIIRFDDDYDVCFKVETHNHPSAIEPYGGAGTGMGGVIRDPLGTGLGAKPIANTDIFCFGPPDYSARKLPKGVLHPKRVMKGVVSGVRDYGNRMGIPTCNGAVLFDEKYIGNPLVYCGNVGLIPKDMATKKVDDGDLILLVGGKTGRDGIHGATFSSGELHAKSEEMSGGAVQIGNAIAEKKMTDAILKARDKKLYKAITDCGAGGLSSAVGEMGEETGAEVCLEKVPLKYHGLSYCEIWISEAQERMVLAVSPENIDEIKDVFEMENVEATVIGKFTSDKRLRLFYSGGKVADIDMDFLHNGLPDTKRKAVWKRPSYKDMNFKSPSNLSPHLLKILSSWNVCSKEWVIRQYDHEVQGASVLKPLVGEENDGPGDSAALRPVLGSDKGIILSCGINPRYGFIDPYWMAASNIDEALRQIISCGGDLGRVAILDNFCWGNTDRPETLGTLVRAAYGCYAIAKAYGVPFISGKDSLNNEYKAGRKSISIPGTLLISAIAVINDVNKLLSMDAKEAGDLVYIAGITKNELGGSHYLMLKGLVGNGVPEVDPGKAKVLMERLSRASNKGLIRAMHDCSEGGLAVAAAEMAFSGGFGMEIDIKKVPCKDKCMRDDVILFSESNSRFIVEVPGKNKEEFESLLNGSDFGLIGEVKKSKAFRVKGLSGKTVIEEDIGKLKTAWQKPFSKW
ncbi:MAG: phosphoribosylformylglycinamidine synthase subunit PurL [Candidatus Omnitrophica bacterium]|nr:phosphoribosylformylglycinamidine synthase subunit PurL [Candidatus Omnitrophota bacterium]